MASLRISRIICWIVAGCIPLNNAHAGLLSDRVIKASQERVADGWYRTLAFAVVEGDKSEVVVFGKLDSGAAPDGDTVYEIGSITKTFTATLLAQEVIDGNLALDTPVSKLLADFRIPSRNGLQITVENIATQHSGLPLMPANFRPMDRDNPYTDSDAPKLKAFLAGYVLPRDPGASYEYSNLGFGLLGFGWSFAPKFGRQLVWHTGNYVTVGLAAIFDRFPEDQVVFMVLTNNTGLTGSTATLLIEGKVQTFPADAARKLINETESLYFGRAP